MISKNLKIVNIDQANVSIQNIAFSYGYGVYENIRVTNNKIRYLDEHIDRLFISLRMLSIVSPFSQEQITKACEELNKQVADETYNLKIILIGGDSPELFILPLKPKFVDRKTYRDGAKVITVEYERYLPQVKSLNMLGSYLVYKQAQEVGAYDALLVDRNGAIPEGSRTNFYALKANVIYTAPDEKVLAGVTRKHILDFATQQGFSIEFETPKLQDLQKYDSLFISNTSSKLLPISQINNEIELTIPKNLLELCSDFRKQY